VRFFKDCFNSVRRNADEIIGISSDTTLSIMKQLQRRLFAAQAESLIAR
jgi:hypothetical protein